MLDRPLLSRDPHPQRVEGVAGLIAAGDDDGLAAALVDLAAANHDVWCLDGAEARDAVRALPDGRRHALILRLVDRAAATAPPVRVDALLIEAAEGIGPDALSWRAARHLSGIAAASETGLPGVLAALAQVAERETGAAPPALLAVMRRTAQEYAKRWPAGLWAPIQPWLDRTAGTLNAGEPWAEAANAQAPAGDLLSHALAASGAKPAPRWSSRAAQLTADLGGEQCRALVRGWLALVPSPRTIPLRPAGRRDPNEVPDPYNARALRGLLYLLAVTPPHPDDVPVVGRLAQYTAEKVPGHGPRSQMVAHACVYALERFSTVPALRELIRLRSLGQPPGIANALAAAIARRSVALGVGPAPDHAPAMTRHIQIESSVSKPCRA
ncbi:hypothetical protein [Dactylosporangium sp. NPDC048998]|uniref:hypothetical protein n=1 Tax=Dactylosporangium sp. NPDC048998 TaxID=3363976 RepID=UPI003719CC98